MLDPGGGATVAELGTLLNAKQQPVVADWYSGLLRLLKRNFVRVRHSDFASVTERETIIEVHKGVAQQHWVIDYAEAERQRAAMMLD